MALSIVNLSLGIPKVLVSPAMVKSLSEVTLICGQPFWLLWILVAIRHVPPLNCGWWQIGYVRTIAPFSDCALLGDDIVITDEAVVAEYSSA